jgi:hypothetical protein
MSSFLGRNSKHHLSPQLYLCTFILPRRLLHHDFEMVSSTRLKWGGSTWDMILVNGEDLGKVLPLFRGLLLLAVLFCFGKDTQSYAIVIS